jgi:O-antigen/teichoic acid export membrane protein
LTDGHAPGLSARLYAGITRNFVAAVFNQGSTLALSFFAANVLGRERFGELTTVQGTLNTVGNLGQLATGYTATKYVAEFRGRDAARAGRVLAVCAAVSTTTACVAAFALLAGAPWIARHAFRAPQLASPLTIAGAAVLFVIMNGFRTGALGGLESYGAIARAGMAGGAAYLVLGAAGALAAGVNGALAGIAASACLQWLLLGASVRREARAHNIPADSPGFWREREVLFGFALPASLSGFVTLPALWLAGMLLVRQPGGLEQMAVFGAANTYRVLVLFVPTNINAVGLSLLNNQRGSADNAFRRVFWWNLTITVLAAVAGAAAVAAAGPWLLAAFGQGFVEGYGTLLVLMAAAVLEALTMAFYQIVQSRAKLWLSLFAIALPRDTLIVVSAFFLAARGGAAGLAWSHLIGWIVATCSVLFITMRIGIHAGVPQTASAVLEPIDRSVP